MGNLMKKLVGQKEAANYLNLSEATLERDRWRGGDIPYIRVGPRAIRYDLEKLDEYIDHNTVKNSSEISK
jgi:excisionase family DNA binding protein